MLEKICLILMVILAIVTINVVNLRKAVIFLAIYSLLCAYVYLLNRAPDVAIAEAIIGAAFTTIIFLVAIKRQKVIRIYYIQGDDDTKEKKRINNECNRAPKVLEQFLFQKELEPKVLHTQDAPEEIYGKDEFDYIFQWKNNKIFLYGRAKDHHFDEIERMFAKNSLVEIIRFTERIG